MRNTISALVLLCTTALAFALPPGSDIGTEFDPPQNLLIRSIGQFTNDPGLEYLASDDVASLGIYRYTAPYLVGTLPVPFQTQITEFMVRDLDGDGLAELICWAEGGGANDYTLGVVDVPSTPTLLWAENLLTTIAPIVDVMNLNPNEPSALVVFIRNTTLRIYSPLSGQLLYDTAQDSSLDPDWRVESFLVDDFDDDGFDEILVGAAYGPMPTQHRSFVIGDRAVSPTSTEGWGASQIMLQQNWPNPSTGSTRIAFDLGQPGRVRLRIYDAAGRLVRQLADGPVSAGSHFKVWDGNDARGTSVASGIYYYELDVDGKQQSRKLVQIR
jgi:hypothetical protein